MKSWLIRNLVYLLQNSCDHEERVSADITDGECGIGWCWTCGSVREPSGYWRRVWRTL